MLEVQVCTVGGAFGALEGFEELCTSFEDLEAIWSLEVHKSWIGALWRYFEAFDVQSSIVSLD